jgi:tRNA(Ile)-lysidine synthase
VLREYSPAIARVLAREAAIAAEDEDRLEQEAIDLARSLVLSDRRGVELDAEGLRSAHPALASRVVRIAVDRAAPGRFVGADRIADVMALAHDPIGVSVSLPGLVATRTADRIVFGRAAEPAFSNSFRFSLSIPGEVTLADWSVSAEPLASGTVPVSPWRESAGESRATVAASALRLPLAVRSRRRGDRFRPLGMAGKTRKLQDVLVDRKVARDQRDGLPLVVDSDERIVWVVGHAVGEDFRVTEASQGVILLKARRLGGAG